MPGFFGDYLGDYLGADLGLPFLPPAFEDFSTLLELDAPATALDLDDFVASLELDTVYTIKAGDRLPSISGRITVPGGIDLTGRPFTMTYAGTTTPGRAVSASNGGLASDSPTLLSGNPTIWLWSHAWASGETDDADTYQVGISATVGGLPCTFPNTGWSSFTIEPQLRVPS